MLELLTQSTWADRIGWMLVHSLWQFALVAVLAVALQWALKRCTAVTRYRALLTALGIMVALPVVTWLWPWSAEAPSAAVALHSAETAEQGLVDQHPYSPAWQRPDSATATGAAPTQVPGELRGDAPGEPRGLEPASFGPAPPLSLVQRRVQPWLPEIVLIWFAGVLVAALRPLLSWCTARRLRVVGISPVGGAAHAVVERAAARLGLDRAVEVLQSALVKGPVVVGYFRPAILLPLSVLTGLPESQLELILAHELAHIRRHDYLINLMQTLVETLFFYHPAVWWLSRQIRNERENCCDDLAMATVGSRADYGRALLAVEQMRATSATLSLAARGGSLVNRIRRIAGCEPASRIAGGGSILCIILVSFAVFAGVTWPTAPATAESEQREAATDTDKATEAESTGESKGETPEEPGEGDWKPGQTIDVQVIHAETKEPLPGVRLEFQYHGPGIDFQDITTKTTDAEGRSQARLPDLRPDAVRIYPSKAGFVPLRVYWGDDLPSPKLPKAVTIPMQPGTIWGGVIRDEQGTPIPDVKVTVHYWESRHGIWNPHRRANIDEKTTTGEDGRWRIDVMPSDVIEDQVRLYVSHPDYVSDRLRRGSHPIPITKRPTIESLQAATSVMVMRKGGVVKGRVIDQRGEPVSKARVYTEEYYGLDQGKPSGTTGKDGRFQLTNVSFSSSVMNDPPRETMRAVRRREIGLVVQADGYTPELVHTAPEGSKSPLEIVLKPGQAVAGRVTDESGEPVEGVSVSVANWLGYRSRFDLRTKTDREGRFRLEDAPLSGALYSFHKEGHMAVQDLPMSPGEDGYEVTLKVPLRVVGSIVDGETMQPLAECTVTKGVEYDDGRAPEWQRGFGTKTITDGRYEFEFASQVFSWRVRVEAEGYMPAVSRIFRSGTTDKGKVTYDFKLFKAGPLTGTAVDAGGRPLAGAEVHLATNLLIVEDGKTASQTVRGARIARTDATGRFELPPEPEPFYLVVLHEEGFAVIDEERFAVDSTVRIKPWTTENRSFRAERSPFLHSGGLARDGEDALSLRLIDEAGEPVEGARVAKSADFHSWPNQFRPYESNWTYWSSTSSDRDGMARIADENLRSIVARHVERKLVAIQRISPEQVKSPETVTITMQPQCKVFGKLTAKELEARKKKIEWSNVYLHLGDGYARPMSCMSDRADFHFYLPPGTYELDAYATDTQHARKTITVKPGQEELEVDSIDLPATVLVLLEGKPAPELRDVVAWKNGGPVKLSDLKGKVVVLAFSSHWVADRPHEWMPNLFTICDKYAGQGLAIVDIRIDQGIGIDSQAKLDEKIGEVKSPFWDDRDLPIPIALALWNRPPFLRTEEEKGADRHLPCTILQDYGINSFPTGVLIDRQGRIVGEFDLRADSDNAVLERLLKEK